MKSKITLILIMISISVFGQKTTKLNLDALQYFNTFLSAKSYIDNVKGSLTYNQYINTLYYKEIMYFFSNPFTEESSLKIEDEFPIPLDDLYYIEETFIQSKGHNILIYTFYLKRKVKRIFNKKEKGKLHKTETKYVDKVWFTFPTGKELDISDINKIKSTIRDIFSNVTIISKSYESKLNLKLIYKLVTYNFLNIDKIMINKYGFKKYDIKDKNLKTFYKIDSNIKDNLLIIKLKHINGKSYNQIIVDISEDYSLEKIKKDLLTDGFKAIAKDERVTVYTRNNIFFSILNKPNKMGFNEMFVELLK